MPLASFSADDDHTRGAKTDCTVVASTITETGVNVSLPGLAFTSVSAGAGHTCGVKTDGTVACWGDNEHGQARPPRGKFTSVSAGGGHTCGVKTDKTIDCWGYKKDWNGKPLGQAKPPARPTIFTCIPS